MYPQVQGIDLRSDATRLDVPVYAVQGRHELESRTALAPEWLVRLGAPAETFVWFEPVGHSTALEEFRTFHDLMTGTVLPETYEPAAGR